MFIPYVFVLAVIGGSAARFFEGLKAVPAVMNNEILIEYVKNTSPTYHAFGTASWFMAEAVCSQNDMTLVEIKDEEENQAVTKFIAGLYDFPGPFWTMANDLYDGHTWSFSLDDRVDYFNWGENEPTADHNQNCVEIRKDGKWYNVECASERYILCQTN